MVRISPTRKFSSAPIPTQVNPCSSVIDQQLVTRINGSHSNKSKPQPHPPFLQLLMCPKCQKANTFNYKTFLHFRSNQTAKIIPPYTYVQSLSNFKTVCLTFFTLSIPSISFPANSYFIPTTFKKSLQTFPLHKIHLFMIIDFLIDNWFLLFLNRLFHPIFTPTPQPTPPTILPSLPSPLYYPKNSILSNHSYFISRPVTLCYCHLKGTWFFLSLFRYLKPAPSLFILHQCKSSLLSSLARFKFNFKCFLRYFIPIFKSNLKLFCWYFIPISPPNLFLIKSCYKLNSVTMQNRFLFPDFHGNYQQNWRGGCISSSISLSILFIHVFSLKAHRKVNIQYVCHF